MDGVPWLEKANPPASIELEEFIRNQPSKVLEGLIKLQPERMVYVTCDPGTLGRDVGALKNGG